MTRMFCFLFLISYSGYSYSAIWETNRDHSEINFFVPYMGVSEVSGRFNEFSGDMIFKEDGKTPQELKVQISASSVDTGNKMRDGHLKGSDFLETHQHPYINFNSNKITSSRANEYEAVGNLTIRGIARPAAIKFSMSQSLKDTWGFENRFVKFKSSLNRKDYKIVWNKTLDGKEFLLGDTIAFSGTFQMQPAKKKTPNSKHMIPDTEYIRERDIERKEKEESYFSKKLRNLINGK